VTASFLQLAPDDNVVVALRKLDPGEALTVGERTITVRNAIPFAHKLAIGDLAAGQTVRKFGVPIGSTTKPVNAGEHVHVHNLGSDYIVNAEDFFEGEA
jgi:altronate dehydratase